jgi:uncharacterized protein
MKSQRKARLLKRLGQIALIIFLILNLLAYGGAYGMTHFRTRGHLGWGFPRPSGSKLPTDMGLEYVTQRVPLNSKEWLETWLIPVAVPKGSVILFPGNAGSKSNQLLAPAQAFHDLGYDTLLVDFRGVGGSSGHTTTLGLREAKDVALMMNYAQRSGLQRPIVLYGVSMGTAAILRAIAHEQVKPDAVILELPFARLLDAVRIRVRATRLPTFPLAELTVFWGSVQSGFNGFFHNPVVYASQVKCPTLILHGKLDRWTTVAEVNQIAKNLLSGSKDVIIFPHTGHSLLVTVDKEHWVQSVERFLQGL